MNASSPSQVIGPPGSSPSRRSTHCSYARLPPHRNWPSSSITRVVEADARCRGPDVVDGPDLAGPHDLVLVEQEDRYPCGIDELGDLGRPVRTEAGV